MVKILFIGAGGFVGSILRYLFSGLVQQITRSISFPYGTLAVNVLGCLIIGLLSQLAESRGVFNDEMRGLLFIGVLGGFTTFSTFSNESVNLLRDGSTSLAVLNVALHLLLGLGAVALGRAAGYLIWR